MKEVVSVCGRCHGFRDDCSKCGGSGRRTTDPEKLTPLMLGVLRVLKDEYTNAYAEGETPARVAHTLGLSGPKRQRGPWSGVQNPAQRIIFPLTALYERGLIRSAARKDRMSGAAYAITQSGIEALRLLCQDTDGDGDCGRNLCPNCGQDFVRKDRDAGD